MCITSSRKSIQCYCYFWPYVFTNFLDSRDQSWSFTCWLDFFGVLFMFSICFPFFRKKVHLVLWNMSTKTSFIWITLKLLCCTNGTYNLLSLRHSNNIDNKILRTHFNIDWAIIKRIKLCSPIQWDSSRNQFVFYFKAWWYESYQLNFLNLLKSSSEIISCNIEDLGIINADD